MSRWTHLWTSEKDEWATPDDLFNDLDSHFGFKFDAAASYDNAKCDLYCTAEEDALSGRWPEGPVWLNPPYSGIKEFCAKATEEAAHNLVCVLAYVRSDTQWFWDMTFRGRCEEIWLIEGRVKFELPGLSSTSAPAPSALFVLSPSAEGVPRLVPYTQPRIRKASKK